MLREMTAQAKPAREKTNHAQKWRSEAQGAPLAGDGASGVVEGSPALRPPSINPGPPPFEFDPETRRMVESMAGFGVPQVDIAALVGTGISVDALTRHFRRELDQGKAKANAKIGQTLFQKAIGGDTASLIWWSKAQMRWRDHDAVASQPVINVNLAWLAGRGVSRVPLAVQGTITAQNAGDETQVIDVIEESVD